MTSHTTAAFRKAFDRLPSSVQRHAREAYKLFRQNPRHPGLGFKPIHPSKPIYSARVGLDYRAVAVVEGDDVVWFWIGSHESYDKLISRL